MIFPRIPSARRRAGTAALVLVAALAAMPASAQFFDDAPLSRREVVIVLRDRGYARIGPPRRAGDVYVVDAWTARGARVRVLVDVYSGDIVGRRPVAPRPDYDAPPHFGPPPPDDDFAPPPLRERQRQAVRPPQVIPAPVPPRRAPMPPERPPHLLGVEEPEAPPTAPAEAAPASREATFIAPPLPEPPPAGETIHDALKRAPADKAGGDVAVPPPAAPF